MLQAYDYATGATYQGVDGSDGLQLLGPDGMNLLGPDGMNLLGYDVGLMAAAAPDEAPLELYNDVECNSFTNTCTSVSFPAEAQIKGLQEALNRAIVAFGIDWQPIEITGNIDPDTLVTAWTVANQIGSDADPLLAKIAGADFAGFLVSSHGSAPEVFGVAQTLATRPTAAAKILDKLSAAAIIQAEKSAKSSKKTKILYWALGAVALVGVAAGAVIYTRKPAFLYSRA